MINQMKISPYILFFKVINIFKATSSYFYLDTSYQITPSILIPLILSLLVIINVSYIAIAIAQPIALSYSSATMNNWSTYTNHENGLKMQYPWDWKVAEHNTTLFTFLSPKENNSDTFQETLIVDILPSYNWKLLQYELILPEIIKSFVVNYNFTKNAHTTLYGLPTTKILFSAIYENHDIRGSAIITIHGDKAYLFLYLAEPLRYNNYSLDVQSMINSFVKSVLPTSELRGISVGSQPNSVYVNSRTNRIYVANFGSNTCSRNLDGLSDKLITTITVGNGPKAIAGNPNTNRIYVVNSGEDTVSVIDSIKNEIIGKPVKVGNSPSDITVDNIGFVFVTNWFNASVSVIDDEEGRVGMEPDVHVGRNPSGLVADDSGDVYVSNTSNSTVSIIGALGGGHTNIHVSADPQGEAFNPNNDLIYVAHTKGDISVIDTSTKTVLKTIKVGFGAENVAVNPNTNIVYVTRFDSNDIDLINSSSNTVIKTIDVGNTIYGSSDILHHGIAVNPNTNVVYVTDQGSNTLFAINGSTNKPLVGVTFNVDHSNSGYIKCNNELIPNNRYIRIDFGAVCTANPKNGFTFSSWSGMASNLGNSSIPRINASDYQNLTANFSPPTAAVTLPNDLLYGVILGPTVGSISAWLIPFFWDRHNRKINLCDIRTHMPKIDQMYELYKGNAEECLHLLTEKRVEITKLLEKGTIDDSTFQILNDRISQYFDELNGN